MASLLERKLIVVTGKGGTGKTTIACALGLLAARRGLRTIVVELGDQHRLPDLFARRNSWTTSARDRQSDGTRGAETRASREPVEHFDRSGPGPARVAASARRPYLGARALVEQHVSVLRRRRPGREGAGEHGQGLRA